MLKLFVKALLFQYFYNCLFDYISSSFSFYCVGIKGADEDEIKEIASTPYSKHVYSVLDFDLIKEVQQQLITEVCAGVEDQLSFLGSGEEGITQHYYHVYFNYIVNIILFFQDKSAIFF